MCFDLSAIVGERSNGHKANESCIIQSCLPLSNKKEELLLHPIINTFIMIKYNEYIVSIVLRLLLRLAMSVAITGLTLTNVPSSQDEHSSSFWIWFYCSGATLIILIITNAYEMTIKVAIFNDWTSIPLNKEFMLSAFFFYLGTLVFLILLALRPPNLLPYMDHIAGIIVLLSWITFTINIRFLMIGHLYNLGLYVMMLNHVTKKVCIFFFIYFSLLIGFIACFTLMLPEKFEQPLQISRAVAMMIGELEYSDTFLESGALIKMLVIVFVILVPIIINNLLIGLTVSDVDGLLKNANMDGIVFRLRNIAFLDHALLSVFRRRHKIMKREILEVTPSPTYPPAPAPIPAPAFAPLKAIPSSPPLLLLLLFSSPSYQTEPGGICSPMKQAHSYSR